MDERAALLERLEHEERAVARHKREIKLHRQALHEAAERRRELRAKLGKLGIGVTFHEAEADGHGRGSPARHPDGD